MSESQLPEPPIPEVQVDEARRRVDAGAVLLDVREPDEWRAGHAEGAQWIPMAEVASRQVEIPAGRDVVVICRSGARSGRVTEALVQGGHDAVNLAGGMQAWAGAGLPVVTDDGSPGTVA
ncbi:MAG: rhodanese-like domain-containing protein [Acidimicrobiia bacterium]|nr:rhodanese-like domain-containing protein [Acidimicrobiia bacterium]